VPQTARVRRGELTRRRLLDAACEVFATRGYHAARVDDIVTAAAASHGTFYLYFANKEAVFRALAAEVADEMRSLAAALPPIPPSADGVHILRSWLAQFSTLYEKSAPVVRAWTEAEIAGDGVGTIGEELLADFSTALGTRAAAGLPDVDGTIAGTALLAMIERLNYYVLTRQVNLGRDAMLNTLAAVTYAAIYGAPVKRR
jgi:AcrR family transcriptional regulator